MNSKVEVIKQLSEIEDENEPLFLLRGRDVIAPIAINKWCLVLRNLNGGMTAKAREAYVCANDMMKWQTGHGSKIPD